MPLYKKKTTKDNKRKKVVKGKTVTGNSKFKSVTNKKTGETTLKTKTKAGKGNNTKKSKTKTVTKVSAKAIMPMLRQLAPDSPAAKKMVAAIKKPAARQAMAKREPLPPMAKRTKMAKKK